MQEKEVDDETNVCPKEREEIKKKSKLTFK